MSSFQKFLACCGLAWFVGLIVLFAAAGIACELTNSGTPAHEIAYRCVTLSYDALTLTILFVLVGALVTAAVVVIFDL
jgi:hypothetical protein